jgi:hypothetical protein
LFRIAEQERENASKAMDISSTILPHWLHDYLIFRYTLLCYHCKLKQVVNLVGGFVKFGVFLAKSS